MNSPPDRGSPASRAGRSRQVLVRRIPGSGGRTVDHVAVEEPMTIRLDDHLVTTTMRTPGHDFELAVGFCLGEGLVPDGIRVRTVRYCATGSADETGWNVVSVDTGGLAPVPEPRLTATTAACGVCGSTSVAGLVDRLAPLTADSPVDTATLLALPDRVRADQPIFASTAATHGAGVFTADGDVLVVREDVGRHNAVDKCVGALHLGPIAGGSVLCVTGRASFEIVQKAWAAGLGTIVAVGMPTSLAVDVAVAGGIRLIGFTRDGGAIDYAP